MSNHVLHKVRDEITHPVINSNRCTYMADSRFAPSQWEMALLCNDVSYWLDASLESALHLYTLLYIPLRLSKLAKPLGLDINTITSLWPRDTMWQPRSWPTVNSVNLFYIQNFHSSEWMSEWLINGLSWKANREVHVIHMSRVIVTHTFKKMYFQKMLSAKREPSCAGLNVKLFHTYILWFS